jgi:serine/threonine protein kinase
MPDSRCPDRQELSDYLLDKLPSEAQSQIDDHLAQCTLCQKAMDTCTQEEGNKDFVGAWGQLAQPDDDQILREAGWDRARQKLASDSSSPRQDDTRPAVALTEAAKIESGKILGGYRLLGLLGAGGMGEVYLAENVATGSAAALKVVQSSRRTDKALFARFQREIKALKRLRHPNIACYHESGDCDDLMYLVMEHVPGVDLEHVVKGVGRVGQADACEIVRQLAEALDHVNARGLVHRDLKPSNVMVTPAGVVKMLDLGLAKWQANPADLSRDASSGGALVGTLDYMAPEQAVASHEVSIQADIYSLGCTLFKLLFGTAPLDHRQFGGNVLAQLNAIHHALEAGELPNLAENCAELPPELAAVLQRMLAVKTEQRYQTPAEVVEAIAPLAAGHDLPALVGRVPVSPSTAVPRSRRTGRRRAIAAWSLVSLCAVSLRRPVDRSPR